MDTAERRAERNQSSKLTYYLERVVAVGPHPSEDHDVIVFESGLMVEGAGHVKPGDMVIWVTKDRDTHEKTVGVFRAEVTPDRIRIEKMNKINPMLIHGMDSERQRREAEIDQVPGMIGLSEAETMEIDMARAEEWIAQMPNPRRI
jgi:hypothetical protein